MKFELFNEDCKKTMKNMEESSIPFIITDPPYLLNFMGKEFDSQHKKLEGKNEGQKMQAWHEEWCREAFRVLKPGGYLVAFGGGRTSHRLASAMENVGFEIRDTMQWIYGSGFPKSYNISKGIDKAGKEESAQWSGWGTALKPAFEPIIIGMKPVEKNFVNNALEHGVSGMNINGGRIKLNNYDIEEYIINRVGYKDGIDHTQVSNKIKSNRTYGNRDTSGVIFNKEGRWPANIILQHHPECEMIGHKKIKGHKGYPNGPGGLWSHEYQQTNKIAKDWNKTSTKQNNASWEGHADADGKETMEHWNCHPNCPIRIMDEQSGERKTTWVSTSHQNNRDGEFLGSMKHPGNQGYNDTGGASRFFYCAKTSKKERNLGTEIQQNIHPTIKPIDLMVYLVNLFSAPDGGVVYDPFMGSGATGIACKILDREFIGSEMEEEYFKIAEKRLEYDGWKEWYSKKNKISQKKSKADKPKDKPTKEEEDNNLFDEFFG